MPHPYEPGMAEEWISTHKALFDHGENVHFAICFESSGEVIGAIGLVIHQDHDESELGYRIGEPYWNQGFCIEAACAVIRYGFEVLGLNRIGALHFTRNPASGRVMEKIGMQFEGTRRQLMKRWGEYVDVACYGILRQDFMQRE